MKRDDFIVLRDEDGQEIEFEYLDIIEWKGKNYIVLLPLDDIQEEEQEEAGEVVILEVSHYEEDEEEFLPVEDESTLMEVFQEFKERHKEEFDFEEEE